MALLIELTFLSHAGFPLNCNIGFFLKHTFCITHYLLIKIGMQQNIEDVEGS